MRGRWRVRETSAGYDLGTILGLSSTNLDRPVEVEAGLNGRGHTSFVTRDVEE